MPVGGVISIYPDVEQGVASWLAATLGVRGVTELPANLAAAVPLVEVARIGGADRDHSIDAATVDVHAYEASRPAARTLALQVRTLLRYQLAGLPLAGGVVLAVNTASGPHWVPYTDVGVRCFTGTYQIVVSTHP
jgi:hypothetical protein